MNINPGELNKRIQIILEKNGGCDEDGFPLNEEKVIRSCYAKVSYTSGKEMIQAGSEFSQAKSGFWYGTHRRKSQPPCLCGTLGKIMISCM